jgi:hypothetical protein
LLKRRTVAPRKQSGFHTKRLFIDPFTFRSHVNITQAFVGIGLHDFQAAAAYIARLPYGRNTNREDKLAVLQEHRGTCSTKHALLHRLASEQQINAALTLGIYLMDGRNTPGVSEVLHKYRIVSIPEAHCYLSCDEKRVDVTCLAGHRLLPVLHEEEISSQQIGNYKVELHRRWLARWAKETKCLYGVKGLWRVREECIAALASA